MKLGYWLTLAIPATSFFLLLLLVLVAAKPYQLPLHSIEWVQQKCAQVHGQFFSNAQSYGCTFAKGIVKCSDGHCLGYAHVARPRVAVPPSMPAYQWRDQW